MTMTIREAYKLTARILRVIAAQNDGKIPYGVRDAIEYSPNFTEYPDGVLGEAVKLLHAWVETRIAAGWRKTCYVPLSVEDFGVCG